MEKHKIDLFNLIAEKKIPVYSNTWMGYSCIKYPTDLMNYCEIIWKTRPTVIIETGTHRGGSALFFANIMDLMGIDGVVFSVDIGHNFSVLPKHNKIRYVTGSSVNPVIVQEIKNSIKDSDVVMVSLDSDHKKGHVLSEMLAYGDFVTVDSYMVVEDGGVNGHPVLPNFGPGPYEAVEEFVSKTDKFVVDEERENRFLFSLFPNGWLKRIR